MKNKSTTIAAAQLNAKQIEMMGKYRNSGEKYTKTRRKVDWHIDFIMHSSAKLSEFCIASIKVSSTIFIKRSVK